MRAMRARDGGLVLEAICRTYRLSAVEIASLAVGDAVTGGIWVWAPMLDLEWYSRLFLTSLGLDPNTAAHTPALWQTWIDPDHLAPAIAQYHVLVESKGRIPYSLDVRYNRPDGGELWVNCRGEVAKWVGSEPAVIVGRHELIDPPGQA